jgi:hypothetical protein
MSDAKRGNHMKHDDEVASALFGEPEDLQEDELDEFLAASGLNVEESRNKLYERLRLEAQPYWMAHKELPTRLKQALEEFRPDTAPVRSEKELNERAGAGVTRIVNAAKSVLPSLPVRDLSFSASFRNAKKEMSTTDQATISRLEKELLDSIESEESDHE